MKRSIMLTLTTFAATCAFAAAASAGPTDDPGIQKREQNQERRIDQGVASGQLTPREAGRLEAEQAKIKQDEARMKADGKLTPKERRRLKQKLNRASDDIYRKKHNQRVVPAN